MLNCRQVTSMASDYVDGRSRGSRASRSAFTC